MHAASEMAVTINCFCIIMGVAIMLLAVCWGRGWLWSCQLWPGRKLEYKAHYFFFHQVIGAHPQLVTWLIFCCHEFMTPWPFLHSSSRSLSHHQLVACQQTSKPLMGCDLDEGAHNDGKPFFGKRQQGQKGCQQGLKMHLRLEPLYVFFFNPSFSANWLY